MTQEEKDLLLKELCAILPYKTLLDIDGERGYLVKIDLKSTTPFVVGEYYNSLGSLNTFAIEQVKPYLRPMSSMTEGEKNEHFGRTMTIDIVQTSKEVIDWLNAHHFDYRGLIPKGLALEAPENMYN